jgi:SNF family Na+-dependent transporter
MIGSCQDPLPWTEHSAGSEGYWFEKVLGLKEVQSSTDNATEVLEEVENFAMKWDLVGSLLFTWIVIFLSTSFGKNIVANVTYVTVLAPFALMAILIVRTATLPGAIDGIRYYIGKFDAKKLGDFQVWANALSQCLFSLSPGFATAITMSSMTDKREDIHRAAIITSTANTIFAVASGFAIFAMIGNIAHDTGQSVEEVASTGGQGLAFIVVASAMPTFGNAANTMSAMFFFMLFTLGLDSSFCWQETLTATVQDLLGKYAGLDKDRRPPSWIISLVTCSFCFVIGLPYATTKGNLILDGIDFYVGTTFLLFVCFVEIIVLNFDFGWKRLEYALQKATLGKRTLRPIIQCCRFDFHVAIPIATLGLFLYQFVESIRTPYLPNNPGIEILSWNLFGICTTLLFLGVWRQGDGKLETLEMPFDEYPWGRKYWTTLEKKSDENHGQEDEIKSMP